MAVLITGGAGFIGSSLAGKLLSEGMEVVVIDNFNNYYSPRIKEGNIKEYINLPGFRLVKKDIRDDLTSMFREYKIDQIVHLAARAGVRPSLKEPMLYNDVNVGGTLNLLEHCRKFGIKKFTFASSSSVYGVNSKVPFSEADPLEHPISPYAVTKIAGEHMCRLYHETYGINIVCLRFFTAYGPRQRPEMAIHKFVRLIEEEKEVPFYGDGATSRDYTYISDIVQGVISAMDSEFGFEIINLGDSHIIQLKELVGEIEKELGKKAKLNYLPLQAGDVPITYADISKAERLLGYKPRIDIKEGIRKFIEWYKNQ